MTQLARRFGEDIRQPELWALLKRQAGRYTQGDHGSLPAEVVAELLSSILYTLEQAPGEGTPLERLLSGQRVLREKVRHAQWLLLRVRASAPGIRNISYRDTLQGLPGFFARYDVDCFAHQVPAQIDYQPALPLPEGPGVDYFTEYLERLLWENRFCGRLAPGEMEALLRADSPDYQGLLINLYEPPFRHALGRLLLGRDPRGLFFGEGDAEALAELLAAIPAPDLGDRLAEQSGALYALLGLSQEGELDYARRVAMALAPRLAAALEAGELGTLFHTRQAERPVEAAYFQDGPRLSDTLLRALMGRLRDAPTLAEKLRLLQSSGIGLRDLGDLLGGCFFGEEIAAVLGLLSPQEREALLALYPGEEAPEWVRVLREHM